MYPFIIGDLLVEHLATVIIIFRVLLAFILSAVFGLERQFKKKPVGFGTFILVTVGSCIITLTAIELSENGNPLGVIGGVITGVGFLGAGALIRREEKKVFGFTTAASIWGFAALGITIGAGLIYLSLIFFTIMLSIVLFDTYFDRHGFGPYQKTLHVTINDMDGWKKVSSTLPNDHRVQNFSFNIKNKEYTFVFVISATREEMNKLPMELMKLKEVVSFKVD